MNTENETTNIRGVVCYFNLFFLSAGKMTSSLTTNLWKPAQLMLCDNEYDKVTKHERLRIILQTFLSLMEHRPSFCPLCMQRAAGREMTGTTVEGLASCGRMRGGG